MYLCTALVHQPGGVSFPCVRILQIVNKSLIRFAKRRVTEGDQYQSINQSINQRENSQAVQAVETTSGVMIIIGHGIVPTVPGAAAMMSSRWGSTPAAIIADGHTSALPIVSTVEPNQAQPNHRRLSGRSMAINDEEEVETISKLCT